MLNQAHALRDFGHAVEVVSWKTSPYEIQKHLRASPAEFQNFRITSFSQGNVLSGTQKEWMGFLISEESVSTPSRLQRVLRAVMSDLTPPELFYYDPSDDLREQLGPVDIEIYHYSFSYSWLKSSVKKARKQIVHFHNLESDLFALRAKQSSPPENFVHQVTSNRLFQNEIKLGTFVDEIWQISDADLREYSKRNSQAPKQRVVGPTMSEELFHKRSAVFAEQGSRSGLVLGFIGALDFEPNFLSLKWILERVAPLLKENQFSGEISQVGKFPERVQELAAPLDFVKLNGFVENTEEWWAKLSFLLVPDLTSAGVRVKILEALGSGVPVLANHKAVERLDPKLQSSPLLTVFDTAEKWASFLKTQKGQAFRASHAGLAMNEALQAKQVYSFFQTLNQS